MRLYSTSESARAGEPSLLAILETLLAMAASAWIGVHYDYWWHVAIGACIAPILLLQTDKSCLYGSRLACALINTVISSIRARVSAIVSSFFMPMVMVPIVAIRVWATVAFVIPHPIVALFLAFPRNWWRSNMAIDLATSPEWLPIPEIMPKSPDPNADDRFGEVYALARWYWGRFSTWPKSSGLLAKFQQTTIRIMSTILYGLFVTTAVSCGLTYRWSIKSTAIIWLPLLWAVRPPNPKNEPWSAHLKLKTTSDLNRVVVFYSVVVLLLFSAKYVLFIAESSLSRSVEVWHGWLGERLGEFVAAFFVRPGEIPIWQLAWTTNALLAITVFFLVRSWLRRAEVGLAVPDTRINRTLAVLYFFRRLLTSYIITCNFVAIIQLARKLPVPEIGSKLFPWL